MLSFKRRWLVLICLLAIGMCHAQDIKSENEKDDAATPTVAAPKSIRTRTLEELDAKNRRDRELSDIATMLKTIPALQNMEQRIIEYLRIQKRFGKLMDDIKDASSRQADIAEDIRTSLLDTKLTPQEEARLHECRQNLKSFAEQQQLMVQQIRLASRGVQNSIGALPPPPSYTSRAGIKMNLVGTMPNAFYISSTCISKDLFIAASESLRLQQEPNLPEANAPYAVANVDYYQASTFCSWLSTYEQAVYTIPGKKVFESLAQFNMFPNEAVWSSTEWKTDDVGQIRAIERFGVKLQQIWDPKQRLSSEQFIGELPIAHYESLGFLVITPAMTGIARRWQLLSQQVANEP